MNQPRRNLMHQSFKLVELLTMVVSFGSAAWLFAWQIPGLDFGEFFAMRLKVSNLLLFLLLVGAWHALFVMMGLYRSQRLATFRQEALDILKATSLGSLVVLNVGFFSRIELITPGFVVAFWVMSSSLTIASRMAVRFILTRARLRGRNIRNVVVVGTNRRAVRLAANLEAQAHLGYNVLGFVDEWWSGLREFKDRGGRLLAGINGLAEILRQAAVDELVIALPISSAYKKCAQIVSQCEEQGITVRFLSDLFDLSSAKVKLESLQETPILTFHTRTIDGWQALVKRFMDVVLSSTLLLLLIPGFAVVALLIRLTSKGPVFFVQDRIGLRKRRFRLLKFRTMVAEAESEMAELEALNQVSGPVFKIEDDPRITPFGRFLRRSSIDELPQLVNVWRGEMSLVGPRPLPVRDFEGFDQDWHRRRFSVAPGITCLWQVNGRSSIPFEQWMKLDMDYIDQWSLWLDLRILARTIPSVLRGAGAA